MAEERWRFRLARREFRSRQIILEGYASLPEDTPGTDEVFWLLIIGPNFLSLEISRELLGERLLDFFMEKLGPPSTPPRIMVGGHEGEEGALSQVAWDFPASGRVHLVQRLSEILGQPLTNLPLSDP
jgi:hypothetical protein